MLRTAKVALAAGAVVAVTLAVLPSPPASEEFQVAFADWRRGGAWYVDDGRGRPAPAAEPVVPVSPTPAGPLMIADGGAAPSTSTGPVGRLAHLPSTAGGRLTDVSSAPLGTSRPRGEREDRGADAAPVRDGMAEYGPLTPPPTFADTPADDAPTAWPTEFPLLSPQPPDADDRQTRREILEELRGLREEVRGLTERWRQLRAPLGDTPAEVGADAP
ncbi:flagellar protein FliT [Alienimonas californiensis]|uniref:Uncharacterized protein n=1 Tax=Alienimonas californiensis TaxID=2527989 RepID=A0A517PAL9_9PLAN|nr:flagellar protein FliT [Alienimonas californiensis]QDT16420.1 hypothetical protein CA12_25220 [Alienimonas californiensis]